MQFEVIPALDLSGGRLARMAREAVELVDAFDGDPLAAAEDFVLGGARWLHVVDLDLAFIGKAGNLQMVSLLAVMDARIQASGGVATEEDVQALLSAGAQRVVLGSAALADRPLVERLLARYGDALAVAVEVAAGGRIRARGRANVDLDEGETLRWLKDVGATRLVHVAVERVSERTGPDLEGAARAATTTFLPVIASGGVRDAEDVRAIASIGPLVQGVILGRALYEGGVTVREAIRSAASAGLDAGPDA